MDMADCSHKYLNEERVCENGMDFIQSQLRLAALQGYKIVTW